MTPFNILTINVTSRIQNVVLSIDEAFRLFLKISDVVTVNAGIKSAKTKKIPSP